MGKRMLRNPSYADGATREVHVTPSQILAKIAELETELAIERAKPAIIKTNEITVEKEVLRDDPVLLEKYNQAMRELGNLKQAKPQIEQQVVEVTKLVKVSVLDKKKLAAAFVVGASLWPLFTLLGKLIK